MIASRATPPPIKVGLFIVGSLPQGPPQTEPVLELKELSSRIRGHLASGGWTGAWDEPVSVEESDSRTKSTSHLNIDEQLIQADEIGAVSIPYSFAANAPANSEIRLAGYRDRVGSFQASATVAINPGSDLFTSPKPWNPVHVTRQIILETLRELNLVPTVELLSVRFASKESRVDSLPRSSLYNLPRMIIGEPSTSVLAGSRVHRSAILLRIADSPWEQYVLSVPKEEDLSLSTEFYLLHQYREGLRILRSSLHDRIETNKGQPSLRQVLAAAFSVQLHDLLTIERVPVSQLRITLSNLANIQHTLERAAEELDGFAARRDLLATFAGLHLGPFLSGRMDTELEPGIPLVSKDIDESIRSRFQAPTNLLLQEVRHQIQRASQYSESIASLLASRIDLIVQKRLEWVQYFVLASAVASAALAILVGLFHLGF